MVVEATVILHITVGHTEYLPIQAKTAGPHQTDTRRMQCGATRFWEVRETAPDRPVQYLQVKII